MSEKIIDVRDENGRGFSFLQFEEVILPTLFKNANPDLSVEEKLKQIKTLPYEDGDVLVCSYPKTGTHWLTNLLNMMFIDNNKLESASSITPVLLEISKLEMSVSNGVPRIFATHLKPDRYPTSIREKGKMVFIARNPKDTCVSLLYNMNKLNMDITWTSLVPQFLQGPILFGTYAEYLKSFEEWLREKPDFKPHILYYENLKKDGVAELRKLQQYLGLKHPDTQLKAILDRCSIDTLRNDVNEGRVKASMVDKADNSIIYRKGEIGDWKNHFTVAQNDLFDTIWSKKLGDTIFEFEFE